MELAMQISSKDKTVKNDTNSSKKGAQLVAMMPAIKKAFNLLGDNIVDLSTENNALKNKIGDYDEKWLQESKQSC